ncbi:MAG: glycosyltransferase [Caldilinea sp. CFX5]|nr:glycosyltransferase [Caldilinea sp. CFX5]
MVGISIVLPTYNRLAQLQRVLAGLSAQSYPLTAFEVVIVADGATDGTNDFLQSYSGPLQVRSFVQPNGGAAAARNRGLQMAQGELIIFLDDDVTPEPQLVAEHVATHQQQQGDVVVLGPMLTPPDVTLKPWVRWEQAMLYKQYADIAAGRWAPTARQFYTGNASVAHRHLLAVGGFDTTFRRAEDVELAYRLADRGLTFLFNDQAIGYHYADRSFASWLQTPYAYGRNDVIFTRDRGQQWLLPTVMQEFQQRHRFIKALTQLCLSRKKLSGAMVQGLRQAAAGSDALGKTTMANRCYSGIFNLLYYQGIADELSGRQAFFALVQQGAPGATVTEASPVFSFEGK